MRESKSGNKLPSLVQPLPYNTSQHGPAQISTGWHNQHKLALINTNQNESARISTNQRESARISTDRHKSVHESARINTNQHKLAQISMYRHKLWTISRLPNSQQTGGAPWINYEQLLCVNSRVDPEALFFLGGGDNSGLALCVCVRLSDLTAGISQSVVIFENNVGLGERERRAEQLYFWARVRC